MNVAAVQKEVLNWDSEDQEQLAAFLGILRRHRDPEHKAELTRLLNDKDPSHWLSLSEPS
jgi:hypothetical protein